MWSPLCPWRGEGLAKANVKSQKISLEKLFPESQRQGAAVSWSGFHKGQSGYGWTLSTGLSAPSVIVWGKKILAHGGGKTDLNGACAGGKRQGRKGTRQEVKATCALPFPLMGR